MEHGLPQVFADEIDEDALEEGMALEDLAKYKSFKVPKNIARTSLLLMARRISKQANDNAPQPKKTINRLNYRLLMFGLTSNDPEIVLKIANFVHDRFDGKPSQAVALTDADGGALIVQVLKLTQNADNPVTK